MPDDSFSEKFTGSKVTSVAAGVKSTRQHGFELEFMITPGKLRKGSYQL
jgi:hypothetical protein